MKKTVLEYTTDIYQEDIPKHILQENKIRLNSFFLEQESVQKKGIQFIFRYVFYSVENLRKVTKQYLLKEYAGLSLEKKSIQLEQIFDMKQYSDIILYGDDTSPETKKLLTEYLQRHDSLKVQFSFFDERNDSNCKDSQSAGEEPCRFQMYRFSMVLQGEFGTDKGHGVVCPIVARA